MEERCVCHGTSDNDIHLNEISLGYLEIYGEIEKLLCALQKRMDNGVE